MATIRDERLRKAAIDCVNPVVFKKTLVVSGPYYFDPVTPELSTGAWLVEIAESDPRWPHPVRPVPSSIAAVRVAFTGSLQDAPGPSFGKHDLLVWIDTTDAALWFTANSHGDDWRVQVADHISAMKRADEEVRREAAKPVVRPSASDEGVRWTIADLVAHIKGRGLAVDTAPVGRDRREPKGNALYLHTLGRNATAANVQWSWVDEASPVVAVTKHESQKAAHIAAVSSYKWTRHWGWFTIHSSSGGRQLVEDICARLPGCEPR